jgi:hypothetical protein
VLGLLRDLDLEVRRFFLERFPYTRVVACMADELIVIAIAHQQRRPRSGLVG